jgi:hypothetical protein
VADERPFVVQPPGNAVVAAEVATLAARRWGLPAPTHLRTGMNALFSAGDEVILRVSHTTAPAEQAVWLMETLSTRGVRVPRMARPNSIAVGDLSVVAIERIHAVGDVDWMAVGEQIRLVHAWSVEEIRGRYPLPRPDDFPWWNTAAVLAEVEDLLDQEARVGLLAAIVRHGDWRAQVADRVVCHGDVHPGNIIQTSEGPVLLDWDLSCLAPAAWDHAMLLTWASVWGGELGAYERFAEGYGRSLAQDPLAESLAVMRNVTATLMRLKAGRTNPAAADEAQRRLRHWRGDPAAPIWSAQ